MTINRFLLHTYIKLHFNDFYVNFGSLEPPSLCLHLRQIHCTKITLPSKSSRLVAEKRGDLHAASSPPRREEPRRRRHRCQAETKHRGASERLLHWAIVLNLVNSILKFRSMFCFISSSELPKVLILVNVYVYTACLRPADNQSSSPYTRASDERFKI